MTLTKVAIASCLIAGASLASASDIKFGVQGGYASGGDDLSDNLDAGDGVSIGAFALVPLSTQGLAVKVAVNTMKAEKSTKEDGDDEKFTLTRLPIDLLLVKKMDKLQLAAGLTYQTNIKLKIKDNQDPSFSPTFKADDALGLALEASYQVYSTDSLGVDVGLRYTNIEYKFKFEDGDESDLDASNIALTAGVSF